MRLCGVVRTIEWKAYNLEDIPTFFITHLDLTFVCSISIAVKSSSRVILRFFSPSPCFPFCLRLGGGGAITEIQGNGRVFPVSGCTRLRWAPPQSHRKSDSIPALVSNAHNLTLKCPVLLEKAIFPTIELPKNASKCAGAEW